MAYVSEISYLVPIIYVYICTCYRGVLCDAAMSALSVRVALLCACALLLHHGAFHSFLLPLYNFIFIALTLNKLLSLMKFWTRCSSTKYNRAVTVHTETKRLDSTFHSFLLFFIDLMLSTNPRDILTMWVKIITR